MSKGKIIVVECTSTATGYIGDIRRLGYEPILMEMPVPEAEREKNRSLHDLYYSLNGDEKPEIVTAGKDYEETLEITRNLHPAFVIPGSDDGLIYATRLARDLGLPGNDPARLDVMRKKDIQQLALKKAGLRAIRGEIVESVEEALAFFHRMENGKVVIKPEMGGATNGVCICNGEAELMDALGYTASMVEKEPGRFLKVLIQEYIDGEECFIDGLFCNGVCHEIAGCMYTKKLIPGRGKIYDTADFFDIHDPKYREVMEYARAVNEVLGLTHGATHNEYMIDSKGIVLIEANCRPSGAMMRTSFQDKSWGFHETMLSLRSYVEPDKLAQDLEKLPRLQMPGTIKPIIVYEDIHVGNLHFDEVAKEFKTFQYYTSPGTNKLYSKTIDLSTCGGMFYFAGKQEDVDADVHLLQDIEKNHPEKLYEIK